MTGNDLLKKFIKYKVLIIISIVLSFAIGFILATVQNEPMYQSKADVYVYRVSQEIASSFEENYYYLFFKNYISDISFDSEVVTDHHATLEVHELLYEYIVELGYDISFEDMREGITSFSRNRQNRKRVTVTFPDKQLTIDIIYKINELAAKSFSDKMTKRINDEIEDRSSKAIKQSLIIDRLVESIAVIDEQVATTNTTSEKEQLDESKNNKQEKLTTYQQLYKENLLMIARLEQVSTFDYWELFHFNTEIIQEGKPVPKSAVNVGFVAMFFAILCWMIIIWIHYIRKEIRGQNE